MPCAFVIRPFGPKKDSAGNTIDFDQVHQQLIAPALAQAGLGGNTTTGEIVESGSIREDMFGLILEADLVVCDVTILNANVFYELGIRHALRKKATVLIKGKPGSDAPPFDLLTDRYMSYLIADPAKSVAGLVDVVNDSLLGERRTDSPVFQLLPGLREVDLSMVQPPADFREEVERAKAAGSRGWLSLLADDVRDRRFRWVGLKLVGQAQWDLEDYDGAKKTWELIRETYPQDIEANLALSNIFERQYRDTGNLEVLERSNQAIGRVLDNADIDRRCRSEALALSGRNQKTKWRSQFDFSAPLQETRRAAMNPALMKAYEAYCGAFMFDLNNLWAGLAAVQLGAILVDLSNETFWADPFTEDSEAETYAKRLRADVPRVLGAVRLAIEAELDRLKPDTNARVWAEISAADARFLDPTAPEQRVIGAYIAAVPANAPFFWNAARGQLELFSKLGFRAELAQKAIDAVSAKVRPPLASAPAKCDHVILIAGHQIDTPDRTSPRFPPASEEKARKLVGERLQRVMNGQAEKVVVLASGAPGTDILAHELCLELGVASTVCLPMPSKEYASRCFPDGFDVWRGRFLDIVEKRKGNVLELSDVNGLPRWLQGSDADPWERGNRWVLQIALAYGASRMTLIALWDERPVEAGPRGGTAHIVQLARKEGNIRVEVVDARQLLA